MIATILWILLWLLIAFHATGGLLALYRVVRYRDVFIHFDADRIAHQPFQPKISVVVRCDLPPDGRAVERIQRLLSLNYTRYEVILIADSARRPDVFEEIRRFFELRPFPLPDESGRLPFPVAALYRGSQGPYGRLILADKPFRAGDDLRRTGAAICQADYMLFVRSLDNDLHHNSLSRLAILKMRDSVRHVTPIRGAARYDCGKCLKGNAFRSLADLCNLRRMYLWGAIPGNDYGQFLILEDISGRRGREEFVPRPQMYLYRPNRLSVYFEELAPGLRHTTLRGRLISWTELLSGLLFWAAGLHLLISPRFSPADAVLLAAATLVPLLASTFSIFVGEVLLREKPRIGSILRLVLLSFPEAVLFCLLAPAAWALSHFRRSAG